jgi:predicted AAA+ superfamily ATPase
MSIRTDVGQLWESFVLSERIKRKHFHLLPINHYFWRTYDQQEVDLIEIQDQQIDAFECKWSNKSAKVPVAFEKSYPEAGFSEINQQNFIQFLT